MDTLSDQAAFSGPMAFFLLFNFACFLSLCLRYLWYRTAFLRNTQSLQGARAPPLAPYVLPWIGLLPLKCLWNPMEYVLTASDLFWNNYPVCTRFATRRICIIQGPKYIQAFFKRSPHKTASRRNGGILQSIFAMPSKAARYHLRDNSGRNLKPAPGTSIAPHQRIDFLNYQSILRLLSGSGFSSLCRRTEKSFLRRLQNVGIGEDWQDWPDGFVFFQSLITSSTIDGLYGRSLLEQHPEFVRDFAQFDASVNTFLAGIPQMLAPEKFAVRERILTTLKDWHVFIKQNRSQQTLWDEDLEASDDPWVTTFVLERISMWSQLDGYDLDAKAAEELAFIWAANTNYVTLAFWTILEIFRNKTLHGRVLEEVEKCRRHKPGGSAEWDMDNLLRQPWLTAVYAETLRLRPNGILLLDEIDDDVKFQDWMLPRGHAPAICTTSAHMDSSVWNPEGRSDDDVAKFRPERFLKASTTPGETREFTLKGKGGAWIPYGGGVHLCPGRQFSKRQIMSIAAMMVWYFDCEILADEAALKMNARKFGFGSLPPIGMVPFRIRRRSGQLNNIDY